MKKQSAFKAYVKQSQRKRATAQRTLAAERAKIKLPFKPEHVTVQELKEAVASLSG